MFCRDKEATAVATALHSYDYHPALREDRGFPLMPKICILIFGYFSSGDVSARIVLPFSLQTYRHSFHRFFKV